jgi:hypothetical protein
MATPAGPSERGEDAETQGPTPNPFLRVPQWRWWKIIRANDQNITADIELARVAISNISRRPYAACQRSIFDSCCEMLNQCIEHQQRVFSNRIFVRQTLFLIMQNIILIAPRETLPSIWLSIKQRLDSINATEIAEFKRSKSIDEIEAHIRLLSDPKKNWSNANEIGPIEGIVREKMKEIKSFVDEKVVAELWSGIVLQRQTYILAGIVLFSLAATVFAILSEAAAMNTPPRVVTTTIAGLLGGALSTVSKPLTRDASLPLVRIALVRPLIGAVAGLFLFLISGHTELAKLAYPYTYAIAIAFGFSERAFSDALGSSANDISKGVSQALGHNQRKSGR